MFWADKILENRKDKEWVNDAWTPSGFVHMGGLKGPVLHDTVYRILKNKGIEARYTFGFDDMDPIDGLPKDLEEKLGEYMGFPVSAAPAPEGEGTFSEYYGRRMRHFFEKLGISADIYLATDYYKKGVYNDAIKTVLDRIDVVRKVYEEMYKKELAKDWFPLNVVCPNCGKLGTTRVTGWDGEKVTYHCVPDMVKWAKGCDKKGEISPYNGAAKLSWKVEWGAKWATFGVTIEGAGKDHASAGGSYDIAFKICEEVFGKKPPMRIPYEFFLSHGKKMSSSKGLGLTGDELLEVMPPELVRFLMIRSQPNQAVEFEPKGTSIIPDLYDDFQEAAQEYSTNQKTDRARAFELSNINSRAFPQVRFATLAQWVQMPNMQEKIKEEGLEEWVEYARVWVDRFAPEDQRFEIKKELPESAGELNDDQKNVLRKIASEIDNAIDGEEFQIKIYEIGKEIGLNGKETFQAIYKSLLGKDFGPKAGWLILSLDKEFVKQRFEEASK
jgi:lysyl-tRNA synthetase, class I